jgi:uncharacterized membrane protein
MVRRFIWILVGLVAAGVLALMLVTPTPPSGKLMIEKRPSPPK